MKLKESIEKNQIEYLKNLGFSIIYHDITYCSDKCITYFIDIEYEEKKHHIVITYSWEFNDAIIHIYTDKEKTKEFKKDVSKEIFDTNDLNKFVTEYIVKNIFK